MRIYTLRGMLTYPFLLVNPMTELSFIHFDKNSQHEYRQTAFKQ